MKPLLFILLCCIPHLLFSQEQPSGIITYHSEITFDSSNLSDSSLNFFDDLPEAEKKALKKRMHRTDKWLKYVYFTPTTAWCYRLENMENKTRAYASDVSRSYKDFTYKHSRLMDVGTDEIGNETFSATSIAVGVPLHTRRVKINPLENYVRTNDRREILGYTCFAYKSTEDSSNVFWVTEELNLPSLFSAGFMHPSSSIKGVVLRHQRKNSYTEAVNIEYCELNESVLRHTPLLELRPEMVLQP